MRIILNDAPTRKMINKPKKDNKANILTRDPSKQPRQNSPDKIAHDKIAHDKIAPDKIARLLVYIL